MADRSLSYYLGPDRGLLAVPGLGVAGLLGAGAYGQQEQ